MYSHAYGITTRLFFRIAPNPETGMKLAASGTFSVQADAFHICAEPFGRTEVDGAQHTVDAVVPVTWALFGVDWPDTAAL